MMNLDDVRDFDAMLKKRINLYRERLRDRLASHRLSLGEARVHKVLIPMMGVYTPGWQALPAVSWELVELVTKQGLVGTGEWSINLDTKARDCLEQFKNAPGRNLLDLDFEEPLYMACVTLPRESLNIVSTPGKSLRTTYWTDRGAPIKPAGRNCRRPNTSIVTRE